MTALHQYDRIEAAAVYRRAPGDQGRNVILSVGDATLVVTDLQDVALDHWSLAAVVRRNPGRSPAAFAPGPDAGAWVETDDAEMIRAIERVQTAVDRTRPRPGRLRRPLLLAVAGGLAVAATLWLPGALARHAAGILPEAATVRLGDQLLAQIATLTGPPCDSGAGSAALAALVARIAPEGPRAARVMPGERPGPLALPGGTVLLDRTSVADPDLAAGALIAGAEAARQHDPARDLLDHAGALATVRLMMTGTLPQAARRRWAEARLVSPPVAAEPDGLAARFARVGVAWGPYARAAGLDAGATEAAPPGPPLLATAQADALRAICD